MATITRITYEFKVKLKGPWGRFVGVMPYYIDDPKVLATLPAPEVQEKYCHERVWALAVKLLDLLGATPSAGIDIELRRRIESFA